MATDLRCSRCQGPLSADSVACPQCSGVSSRSPRGSRIVAAKPYKAPPGWVVAEATRVPAPPPVESSSRSWIAAPIAAFLGLLVLFGGWCWLTAQKAHTPAAAAPVAVAPIEEVAKPAPVSQPPVADADAGVRSRRYRRQGRSARSASISVERPPDFRARRSADRAKLLPISTSVPAEKVDAAIQRGVALIRKRPGEWLTSDRSLGWVALPALALIESGVEPNDPQIQRAAGRVREQATTNSATYEISLAILFLDRLGDPADDPLIQRLAARLIAGQTSQFGWTYHCRLPHDKEILLLKALDLMRPQFDLSMPLSREPGKGLLELQMPLAAGSTTPADAPKSDSRKSDASKMAMPFDLSADAQRLVRELPKDLRRIPALDPEATTKPRRNFRNSGDDNSNTQFAMLALWAAHRHGVSVERSLLLADQRFAQTQLPDGSWAYHVDSESNSASMTCVGLLGLAVGHGSLLRSEKPAGAVEDRAIRKGLDALSQWIDVDGDPDEGGRLNLYKLWSIERVCVLYGLPTIAGKDWYGWGAKRLLRDQDSTGAWHGGGYNGSTTMVDTSFALLFLRRSNLVQDLTDRLQLQMPIRDVRSEP